MIRTFLFVIFVIFSGLITLNYLDKNNPINLSTKTCIVTGASSGIGRELGLQMMQRGWKVIGIARRIHLLNEQQKTNPYLFTPIECDVSDLQQIHSTCEKIRSLNLHPTLFFLNAGMGKPQCNDEQLVPITKKTFNTNYFGALAWIDEWLSSIKKDGGGTFVATLSVMTLMALPGSSAYSSSKTALAHSFESLRRQYLYEKIGFCSVFSGPVKTEMLKGTGEELPFTHTATEEAEYIINQVFAGKKHIEPSWIYGIIFRVLSILPDWAILKLADLSTNNPK